MHRTHVYISATCLSSLVSGASMDASTREELLWQASHGGRNQRARAHEELLPAEVSASVSDTDRLASPFNRFESDLVAYMIDQWAWGLLSAPRCSKASSNQCGRPEAIVESCFSRPFLCVRKPSGLGWHRSSGTTSRQCPSRFVFDFRGAFCAKAIPSLGSPKGRETSQRPAADAVCTVFYVVTARTLPLVLH